MLEFEHLFKSSDITSSVSKAGRSSEDAASGNNRGEAFKTIFEDSIGSGIAAKNGNISPRSSAQQQAKEYRNLSGGSALILEGTKPTDESIAEFAALQGIDPNVIALIMGDSPTMSSPNLQNADARSINVGTNREFNNDVITSGHNNPTINGIEASALDALGKKAMVEFAPATIRESGGAIKAKNNLITSGHNNPTINGLEASTLDALGKKGMVEFAPATIRESEGAIKAKNNSTRNLLDILKASQSKVSIRESDSKNIAGLQVRNPLDGESLNKEAVFIAIQNKIIEPSSKLAHKNIIKFQNAIPIVGVQKLDMINLGVDAEEILSLLSSGGAGSIQASLGSSVRADPHTHLIANQMPDFRADLTAKSFAETQANIDQEQLIRRQDKYLEISRRLTEALGERLTAQISKGAWRVEMDLHPKSLGRIEINLEMKNGALEAYFNPSQNVTRELLQDTFEKLKDTLAQHGIDSAYVGLGSGKKQHSDGNPTDDTLVAKRDAESDNLSISSSAKKTHLSADGLDIQV